MPRRPRGHTECRLHHITARGNNRRTIFEDDYDRERFYGILGLGIAERDVECHADVLMGNHFHLLLEGAMAAISALLWFVNFRYAIGYNLRHGRINHLLGRRFHSSEIPDDQAARAVGIYIALNPVRAGLCARPESWTFGSFAAHAGLAEARGHLSSGFTNDVYARRGTTLASATARALADGDGGRPALATLLPQLEHLTSTHVRHAREVFGYQPDEIMRYYAVSERTLRRRLAA
jgi:REP element-mobilizing transposase RayT